VIRVELEVINLFEVLLRHVLSPRLPVSVCLEVGVSLGIASDEFSSSELDFVIASHPSI